MGKPSSRRRILRCGRCSTSPCWKGSRSRPTTKCAPSWIVGSLHDPNKNDGFGDAQAAGGSPSSTVSPSASIASSRAARIVPASRPGTSSPGPPMGRQVTRNRRTPFRETTAPTGRVGHEGVSEPREGTSEGTRFRPSIRGRIARLAAEDGLSVRQAAVRRPGGCGGTCPAATPAYVALAELIGADPPSRSTGASAAPRACDARPPPRPGDPGSRSAARGRVQAAAPSRRRDHRGALGRLSPLMPRSTDTSAAVVRPPTREARPPRRTGTRLERPGAIE